MKLKVLFITRSYSRDKGGGKEIYNYNLFNALNKKADIKLIAMCGCIVNLIWFYPYSFLKGFFLCILNRIDVIHTGDIIMLPGSLILSTIFNKKLSVTIYGLDITYKSEIYQSIFIPPIKKCDRIIAISKVTKEEGIKKGISESRIIVIPCGINPYEFNIKQDKKQSRRYIENKFGIRLENKRVILTVGRLVKRKGVQWFVENVIPKIGNNYIYIISGEGQERKNIENAIEKHKLRNRVFLLGRTDFETLKLLYKASDVFVMPNIKVEGDMEGFGIVAIEATSAGVPVVASNIEGIRDAVINNKTGLLVEEKDVNAFIRAIKLASKLDRISMIGLVNTNYSWDNIASQYVAVWGRGK